MKAASKFEDDSKVLRKQLVESEQKVQDLEKAVSDYQVEVKNNHDRSFEVMPSLQNQPEDTDQNISMEAQQWSLEQVAQVLDVFFSFFSFFFSGP